MLAAPWVALEAEAAIRSGEEDATTPEPTWPWEDVFLGAALSHAARGARLAVVHVGTSGRPGVFSWEWGVKAAPSTLLWHMRLKQPQRIYALEAWAAKEGARCDLAFSQLACREYVSCAGARWEACEPELGIDRAGTNVRGNCSTVQRPVAALPPRVRGGVGRGRGRGSRRGARRRRGRESARS